MKHFKKFCLICILAIISLLVIYPVFYTICYRNEIIRNISWIEYEVKAGDSLWQIARTHCPVTVNIQHWIHEIRTQNQIANPGALQVGSIVRIPVSR